MSTILDALKRLEKEGRAEEGLAAPHAITKAGGQRQRFLRRRFGLGIYILAAMGALAVIIWRNGGLPGKTFSPLTAKPDPPAITAPPQMAAVPSSNASPGGMPAPKRIPSTMAAPVGPSVKTKIQDPPVLPTRDSRHTVGPTFSQQVQARRLPQRTLTDRPGAGAATSQTADAQASRARQGSASPRDAEAGRTENIATAQYQGGDARKPADMPSGKNIGLPPSAVPHAYADAEPLARGTLQLQAISWSDVPKARVTVVNGRILREGQSVEGYTVVQIRPAEVILHHNGYHWVLGYSRQ